MFSTTLPAALLIAATTIQWGIVDCISVPTGKETPITPAKVTPRPVYQRIPRAPAPVFEYTQENPEPPPLDPSYTPATYKFINALRPKSIYYVPVRLRVPYDGIPEVGPFVSKPQYSVIDYAFPKRQYFYQEETKPAYQFTKKYTPFKQVAKESYSKEYLYKPYEGKPIKSVYPKKAITYPENMKQYFYQFGQN